MIMALPRPTIPEFIIDKIASNCTRVRVTFADGSSKYLGVRAEKLGPNVLALYISAGGESPSNYVVKIELACTVLKVGLDYIIYYVPIISFATDVTGENVGIPIDALSGGILITVYLI